MSSRAAYVPPHRRRHHPEQGAGSKTVEELSNNPGGRKWNRNNNNNNDDIVDSTNLLCGAFSRVCCINLRRRQDRWDTFCSRLQSTLGKNHPFLQKVERFDAIDGTALLADDDDDTLRMLPCLLEWDATSNSMYDRHIQPPMTKRMTPGEVGCAMSHVQLWQELVNSSSDCDKEEEEEEEAFWNDKNYRMLILEDDATFYRGNQQRKMNSFAARGRGGGQGQISGRGRSNNWEGNSHSRDLEGFLAAFSSLWQIVPPDWDILYLGFSDRGERLPVSENEKKLGKALPVDIHVFRPTYGFHTHAYALSKSAASILLHNLPVVGPLDVWLADNEWFGLNVYCGVVAGEGWRGQGACLVAQRKHDTSSDIHQSGRTDER